jgi:hypothetical protein
MGQPNRAGNGVNPLKLAESLKFVAAAIEEKYNSEGEGLSIERIEVYQSPHGAVIMTIFYNDNSYSGPHVMAKF